MSEEIDTHLIDSCIKYIEDKNMFYLAKEGYAVYYCSFTGVKSDYTWTKVSVVQMLRTLRAIYLGLSHSPLLKEVHLITAFQELERTYEYSVSTSSKVVKGVFNYQEHSETKMVDHIMYIICNYCVDIGFEGVYVNQILDIYQEAATLLKAKPRAGEAFKLLLSNFEASGYETRTGIRRPTIDGKKTRVVLRYGGQPKDIVYISDITKGYIIQKIIDSLA